MEIGDDQYIISKGEPDIVYPILHSVDFWNDGKPGPVTEIDVSYVKAPVSFLGEGNRKNYILGSGDYVNQYRFDVRMDIWMSEDDW